MMSFIGRSASQTVAKPILEFELRNVLCSEEIKAIVDNFFIKLNEYPGSRGIIVGQADSKIEGRFDHYLDAIRKGMLFRKYSIDRITFVRTVNGNEMLFQFWRVPNGSNPPPIGAMYSRQPVVEATLFDKSWINSVYGRGVFFGGEDEPCDFGLNFDGFADRLRSDKSLLGYLVTFSEIGHKRVKERTAAFRTIKNLIRHYRIAKNRIRYLYGGPKTNDEMQLWLVPKQSTLSLSTVQAKSAFR